MMDSVLLVQNLLVSDYILAVCELEQASWSHTKPCAQADCTSDDPCCSNGCVLGVVTTEFAVSKWTAALKKQQNESKKRHAANKAKSGQRSHNSSLDADLSSPRGKTPKSKQVLPKLKKTAKAAKTAKTRSSTKPGSSSPTKGKPSKRKMVDEDDAADDDDTDTRSAKGDKSKRQKQQH